MPSKCRVKQTNFIQNSFNTGTTQVEIITPLKQQLRKCRGTAELRAMKTIGIDVQIMLLRIRTRMRITYTCIQY